MLKTSCHCGAVKFEVARRPVAVTECNCSICRRYGTRWAYYRRKSTRLEAAAEALERYVRGRNLAFVRCRTCGCVVLWEPIRARGEADRIGVNMRLAEDPAQLAGIRVHRLDGAQSWRTAGYHTLTDPAW